MRCGVFLLSLVLACGRSPPPEHGLADGDKVWISVGGVPLKVEVASTPKSRSQGLMFREEMGWDEGMLFAFDREAMHGFWMKDTFIPLSIAFIDSRRTIVAIEDMEPLDESVHLPPRPVLYALEVHRGWFRAHGVRVGDKIEFLPSPPEPRDTVGDEGPSGGKEL